MSFEDDAITRTKKRFKIMTEHPYTTLWEGWKIGGHGGGTINHAWSGGALTLLSQYAAGVAPEKPGYAMYHVLPQMGALKHIQTVVPSVKGNINLELGNQASSFTLKLTSPTDTVARVGIPRRVGNTIQHIEANGTRVWSRGKPAKQIKNLKFIKSSKDYILFLVQPGTWKFTAHRLAE